MAKQRFTLRSSSESPEQALFVVSRAPPAANGGADAQPLIVASTIAARGEYQPIIFVVFMHVTTATFGPCPVKAGTETA